MPARALSFSEDGCTERRSRLHYSSGGAGSIRQRRAAAGHQRTAGRDFPQPAVLMRHRCLAQG
ncbi:hypothetical protein KCP77_25040 (plasmid) [Salmonella enterica subsp. enterica]|nr:hypothetical protein KCP77_25040 [Salmonella enterica subsp. enterica]